MKRILTTLSQKWPEYLLEILVLIVGIYGAFALESWKEERSDKELELKMLLGLKEEFSRNNLQFKSHRELKEKAFTEQKEYLEILKSGGETLEIVLKYQQNTGGNTFNPSNGVLKSIISSGTIEKIRNDSLKYALSRWIDLLLDLQEDEFLYLKFLVGDRDLNERSIIPKDGHRFHDWSDDRYLNAYLTLAKDLEHRDIIITSVLFLSVQLDEILLVQAGFDEILGLVQSEIDALK